MGTGEGGGEVVGKGWSLLVKAFCFSMSELHHIFIMLSHRDLLPLILCGIVHCHDYQIKRVESAFLLGPALNRVACT